MNTTSSGAGLGRFARGLAVGTAAFGAVVLAAIGAVIALGVLVTGAVVVTLYRLLRPATAAAAAPAGETRRAVIDVEYRVIEPAAPVSPATPAAGRWDPQLTQTKRS